MKMASQKGNANN